MNRIQFFVLTGVSSLLLLFLVSHIVLAWELGKDQTLLALDQRKITQGAASQRNWKQLVVRIYQDSQKTQDAGLKDLLARQQITVSPAPESNNATGMPIPPNSSSSR